MKPAKDTKNKENKGGKLLTYDKDLFLRYMIRASFEYGRADNVNFREEDGFCYDFGNSGFLLTSYPKSPAFSQDSNRGMTYGVEIISDNCAFNNAHVRRIVETSRNSQGAQFAQFVFRKDGVSGNPEEQVVLLDSVPLEDC